MNEENGLKNSWKCTSSAMFPLKQLIFTNKRKNKWLRNNHLKNKKEKKEQKKAKERKMKWISF